MVENDVERAAGDAQRAEAYLELLESGSPAELHEGLEHFGHRAHLLVAWHLCRSAPLPRALERISAALRRATEGVGAGERYHETLTWAWTMVVAERCAEAEPGEDFTRFVARNPDLVRGREALEGRYDRATLDSARARARFVLPTLPEGARHGS